MSAGLRTLRGIACLMAICILLNALTGCFGGENHIQEETETGLLHLEDSEGVLIIGPDGTIIFDFGQGSFGSSDIGETIEIWGTVVADELNIRTNPGTHNDICGSLYQYDRVQILNQTIVNDVLWGETEAGWICMDYVLLDDPSLVLTEQKTFRVVVLEDLVAYEGPGSRYSACGSCTAGSRLVVLETCGKWGRTEMGWICLDYVRRDDGTGGDIIGSWYCRLATSGGGGYLYGIYTFRADGTYSFLYASLHMLYPGEYGDLGTVDGNYSLEHDMLITESGCIPMLIEGDTLYLTENGEVHIYLRGDLQDAMVDMSSQPEETEPAEPMPAETEPAATEPPKVDAPVINSSIHGTWQVMYVCTYCESGQCLTSNGYWTFNSDGTFTALEQDAHYLYDPETGPVNDPNAMGVGSQMKEGTYTFDGSTLVLTYTFIEWEDITSPVIETKWVTIQDGCLSMTDSQYNYTMVMYKGTREEVARSLFGD